MLAKKDSFYWRMEKASVCEESNSSTCERTHLLMKEEGFRHNGKGILDDVSKFEAVLDGWSNLGPTYIAIGRPCGNFHSE